MTFVLQTFGTQTRGANRKPWSSVQARFSSTRSVHSNFLFRTKSRFLEIKRQMLRSLAHRINHGANNRQFQCKLMFLFEVQSKGNARKQLAARHLVGGQSTPQSELSILRERCFHRITSSSPSIVFVFPASPDSPLPVVFYVCLLIDSAQLLVLCRSQPKGKYANRAGPGDEWCTPV